MKLKPYVERVVSRLRGPLQTRDGWVAHCPLPSHSGGSGDQHASLRVSVGEGGLVLIHCRGGCCKRAILQSMGMTFADLYAPPGAERQEPICQQADEEIGVEDLGLRHNVYTQLLKACPLTKAHRKHLKARGLSDDDIAGAGYASLDPKDIRWVGDLFTKLEQDLYSVPGFEPGVGGVPRLVAKSPGILVPCRNHAANILALKVRTTGVLTDSGEVPRYLYFSGGEGLSCGSHVHFPLNHELESEPERVVVTEGEIKADVSSALTGATFLGLPGVSAYAKAVPALAYLGNRLTSVDVAFDWPDVLSKAGVRRSLLALLRDLKNAGYVPGVLRWKGDHKGVDDAINAGAELERLSGEGLKALEQELRAGVVTAPRASKWPLSSASWSPPPFPVEALPDSLRLPAEGVAHSRQCPVDFAALSMFTAAASAIGTSRHLEVCPGWREFPCLYSAIVAPPGSRKTPAIRAALKPVYVRQAEAARRYEGSEDDVLEHTWIQDCTVEAVVSVLKQQPRGVLLVQDELVSWVLGDNKYRGGKGSDRQTWLSLWSSEPIKNDRKVSGSTHVASPLLCALGGIQPDMLSSLSDVRGREDGFVHRLLFSYPDAGKPVLWGDGRNAPSSPHEANWASLMQRLYDLQFDADGCPVRLEFDEDGAGAWAKFYDSHTLEMYAPGFPLRMHGPWSKMYAYCARFALVCALARSPSPEHLLTVGAEDVERARHLVDYFARMAWGVALSMSRRENDSLLPRLTAMAGEAPVEVRKFMKSEGLTRSQTFALFRRAEDLGVGEVTKDKSDSGRGGEVFVLLPDEE